VHSLRQRSGSINFCSQHLHGTCQRHGELPAGCYCPDGPLRHGRLLRRTEQDRLLMPAAMVLAGLVTRRAILRVSLAAASILILVVSIAFSAAVAVLGASAADTPSVCSQSGAAGQPGASESGALSIRTNSRAPVSVTARQMAVAGDYVSIGQQLGVPRDGQIIAIMMAPQESSLRVLANTNVPASLSYPHDGIGNDHDSLGTAQQRPAAGWGTVEQLMDPAYNVRAFYGGPTGPNRGSPPGVVGYPELAIHEQRPSGASRSGVGVSGVVRAVGG
jgi:hypothetical protein